MSSPPRAFRPIECPGAPMRPICQFSPPRAANSSACPGAPKKRTKLKNAFLKLRCLGELIRAGKRLRRAMDYHLSQGGGSPNQ